MKIVCMLMFAGLVGAPLMAQARGGSGENTPQAQAEKNGKSVQVELSNDKAVVTVGVKAEYTSYTISKDDKGEFKEEDLAKLPQWARDLFEKQLKAIKKGAATPAEGGKGVQR